MARIVGVDIPNEKVTWVALTYVHGIGKKTAFDILEAVGVNPQRRVKDLTDDELERLGAGLRDLEEALEQIKRDHDLTAPVEELRRGLDDVVEEVVDKLVNPDRWADEAR